MKFTDKLWQEIEPIYGAILNLPFIEELISGKLSLEIFQFYLQQDALYLQDFSKALAITGARARRPDSQLQFFEFATGAIVTERALHESYFEEYEIAESTRHSPSCFSYANFLIATAYQQPYEVSVAALLPCFWIYRDVGHYIFQRAEKENPYERWIATYSGDEFGEAVERAIEMTDHAAAEVNEKTREAMTGHFVKSSRLEWMFWHSAYQKEQWRP